MSNKTPIHLFYLLVLVFFSSGCLGTRFLDKGEYVLYKQEIKGNHGIRKRDLKSFYQQRPNLRIPLVEITPYVYTYEFGERMYDKEKQEQKLENIKVKHAQKIAEVEAETKNKKGRLKRLKRRRSKRVSKQQKTLSEGNLLMRIGNPLVTYDSSISTKVASQMNSYLKSKSYFNAEVDFSVGKNLKMATVTYQVKQGNPYKLQKISHRTTDANLNQLIKQSEKESFLVVGENYDEGKLKLERERIDKLFRNNGYYDFNKQYINYLVDTTVGNNRIVLAMVINNPAARGHHKLFKVGSVTFIENADKTEAEKNKGVAYKGVTYHFSSKKYSKKILSRRIFIQPGALYSLENTKNTQRTMANLDAFHLIDVNYDTSGGKFAARIYTRPLKKYVTTNEIGVNVTQGFPGPFYNLGFKDRNVFNGFDILELNGRIGIEGVVSASNTGNAYASKEYGVNGSILFPQFILPVSSKARARLILFNPKTRVSLSFQFTDRPEYDRGNLNAAFIYKWQKGNKVSYDLSALDIGIIDTQIKSKEFQDNLNSLNERGNRLINSFRPSFVNSTSLSATFNFNNYGIYGGGKSSSALRIFMEAGGTPFHFLGADFLADKGVEYYQYFKLSTDFRKYLPLSTENTMLAYRVSIGMAVSYGENNILPYEKYFFSGGSNSNRAWRPRRLGPGSYRELTAEQDENSLINYNFEQPGEILFENNLEFRQKIAGFLHGAIFIDAGNVWTFDDDSRPGANISTDFLSEIAVGAGIGLRLNFSFLIIRIDVGAKMREPARPKGQRYIGNNVFRLKPLPQQIVYNIGIGYPF